MKAALVAGAVVLVLTAGGALAQSAPDGASLYGRCSACHTASGAGLPGAFPALNRDVRELATRPEGRRYLALVVMTGLIGPLTVEGQSYRNVMPAQSGLDAAAVAAVLNHVGQRIAHDGPAWRAFTAEEVAGYTAATPRPGPAELAALHARLVP
jgi:cytochrome c5